MWQDWNLLADDGAEAAAGTPARRLERVVPAPARCYRGVRSGRCIDDEISRNRQGHEAGYADPGFNRRSARPSPSTHQVMQRSSQSRLKGRATGTQRLGQFERRANLVRDRCEVSEIEDADPGGMRDGIGAAHGVKLLEQLRNVILGGMRRDAEAAANQLVRRALGKECKHFQFARSEREIGFRRRRCRRSSDDNRVGVIAFADELECVDLGQQRCDPVGENGIGDVDCQPQPIARARIAQAAGLSPI